MAYPVIIPTFIGDTILMKYQKIIHRTPYNTTMIRVHFDKEVPKIHCGFTVKNQRLINVKYTLQSLCATENYVIYERVVIMIGTYDVIDHYHGYLTRYYMAGILHELIRFLWENDIKEIILCTIPRIAGVCSGQNSTLEYYNNYIRSLDGVKYRSGTIKVADIHEELLSDAMFESNGLLPNIPGLRKIFNILHPLQR